ncbi:hypothetical protein Dsin_027252 [Dipteronia sinensis]|uniref:Uncharacterized protein n=1 Tax=Dipteronia sinensis TaxID=43782 RepID=A0AAE0DTE1_9ROSI|nr:hypothetical protein Dsin_027252 [Dipteronia sinensis]
MLRSSSTPVIGSLLSPFSDSPNRDFETTINTKLSFSQGLHHLNLAPPSCCSSPIFQFSRETNSSTPKGFRKSRSDGYLEGLAYSSRDSEAFRNSNTQHKSSNKKYKSMLRSSPSFSIYNSVDEIEDEEIIGQGSGDRRSIGENCFNWRVHRLYG